MRYRALFFAVFAASSAVAQSPSTVIGQGSSAQYAKELMDREVAFEQMVPPGMSIEAKEVSRSGKSGVDLVVRYQIFVRGVPQNELFRQVSWPVNADNPSTVMEGISVGKDGILNCAGRSPEQCGDANKPDDPIEFIFGPAKGEPYRIAFVSDKVKIGLVIVPDPIEVTDRGCSLNAVRLTSKFELAFLSGSGFLPNSPVHLQISSGATSNLTLQANAQGIVRTGLTPYTKGKNSGITKVKVIEPRCSPEVNIPWGA